MGSRAARWGGAQEENTQLIASESPLSGKVLKAAATKLPPELSQTALDASRRIVPPLEGGDVWTDDRAPVEWLVVASIVEEAQRR